MELATLRRDKTNPKPSTRALPGSREKVDILASRAQRGESLFQTDDAAWRESALVAWLKAPSEFRAAMLRRL